MSKQINVNIRMDSEIKEQADRLFNELGFNLTTAINAFVRQAIRERAIPFYITTGDLSSVKTNSRNRADLISRGRESGRVLNVGEAFRMYPVTEEDHEGKLEYWTCEKEK
ncbi:MAG: type II toxin-antitoxin system RelB/DinJ family antitoxin [Oscillospiraceae bacterium]|nr:type II toxin-antitoxin system RelB/DinJ family antitoxin [Oscillospiraceae bacterium]